MSRSFTRGAFVRITCGQRTIDGMVLLASENGRSLMLGFDGALRLPSGGVCIGSVPVLMDDAGVYRDLVEGTELKVEPL